MGPRKPEVEFINLSKLEENINSPPTPSLKTAIEELKKLANGALKKGPYSVTFDKKEPHIAASGDVHDFLSYAPYFWPSENNDGKYVQKDGKRNPDVKLADDQSQLEGFAEQLKYLCLGYKVFKNEDYAKRAVYLIKVFLIDEETKMNPNVDYGQVVRGVDNPTGKGRPFGILSTRSLAMVCNVLPILFKNTGYKLISDKVEKWFQDYGKWLMTSELGKQEAATKNNHASWYWVQVIMVQSTFPQPKTCCIHDLKKWITPFLSTTYPQQIDKLTGDQPLESKRTKPFHYLVFNIEALLYITNWIHSRSFEVRQIFESCFKKEEDQDLLWKAIDYMIHWDTEKNNEDCSYGVRPVESACIRLTSSNCFDQHQDRFQKYQCFLQKTKSTSFAENISGSKNALHPLWSR
ncbi:alginate lyase-domain-containing protein [Cunninghamella echinulata]|nr:alginate lyase-domain-containing protein [Cunninghamella echinulata]